MPLPFYSDAVLVDDFGFEDQSVRNKWQSICALIDRYAVNPRLDDRTNYQRAFLFTAATLATVANTKPATLFPQGGDQVENKLDLLKIFYIQLLRLSNHPNSHANTWGPEAQAIISKLNQITEAINQIEDLQEGYRKWERVSNITACIAFVAFVATTIGTNGDGTAVYTSLIAGMATVIASKVALHCIFTAPIEQLKRNIFRVCRNIIPVSAQGEEVENELENKEEAHVDNSLRQAANAESKHAPEARQIEASGEVKRDFIDSPADSKQVQVEPQRFQDPQTAKLNAMLELAAKLKQSSAFEGSSGPCCLECKILQNGPFPEGKQHEDLIIFPVLQAMDGKPTKYYGPLHQSCALERVRRDGAIERDFVRPMPLIIKIDVNGNPIIELEETIPVGRAIATYSESSEPLQQPVPPLPTTSSAALVVLAQSSIRFESKRNSVAGDFKTESHASLDVTIAASAVSALSSVSSQASSPASSLDAQIAALPDPPSSDIQLASVEIDIGGKDVKSGEGEPRRRMAPA